MPTRGSNVLERFLLGSVTERVVRRSDVPVLTISPDDGGGLQYPYRNVIVPTDGSETATAALAAGVDVANASDAALHLIHVVEDSGFGFGSPGDDEAVRAEANEILETSADTARNASVESVTTTLETGTVHEEVLEYVETHDVDLIVVGTRGRTNLDRYLLGSVAEKLVRAAPVPRHDGSGGRRVTGTGPE